MALVCYLSDRIDPINQDALYNFYFCLTNIADNSKSLLTIGKHKRQESYFFISN